MGSAAGVLPAGSAALFDRRASVEVELLHERMALSNADDAMLLAGRNLALLGGELIQFGIAEPVSPTRWRLRELLRGRAGSEAAITAHAAGEDFIVIAAPALVAIDASDVAGGGALRIAGIADPEPDPRAPPPIRAGHPLSPAHLTAAIAADGSVALSWVRRSRAGFAWRDGVDAPIGEDREAYRVTIGDADAPIAETGASALIVSAATIAAHGPGAVTVRVRQIGSLGLSPPASIEIIA